MTHASVDEQIAAIERSGTRCVRGAAAALASPLETLLVGEEGVEFAPPKTGAYEPLDPPTFHS